VLESSVSSARGRLTLFGAPYPFRNPDNVPEQVPEPVLERAPERVLEREHVPGALSVTSPSRFLKIVPECLGNVHIVSDKSKSLPENIR
jgi:hypothetical protein